MGRKLGDVGRNDVDGEQVRGNRAEKLVVE